MESRLDARTIGRALNAHLAEDVAVSNVRPVPLDFSPRYWGRRRWYRYTIWNAEARAPLLRRTAWHYVGNLDVAAMQQTAQRLTGTHDFRACAGALEEGRTPVRTIFRTGWTAEGPTLLFDIEGDAFLPQMVRRITGALVQVGRGALKEEDFVARIRAAKPGTVGPTAPAHGLSLQRVEYDEGYV